MKRIVVRALTFRKRVQRGTALVMGLGLAAPVWAAPIISPFAADLPASSYSQDANYGTWYYGSSAQSVFNGGYWNAGSQGSHWVQADMGSTQTLSMVKVNYAGSYTGGSIPGGFINVYLSDNPIGNSWSSLTPIAAVSGPGAHAGTGLYELSFAPASGRYLQVVANYSTYSWTALGDTLARTNWTDPVTASGSAVPEPASWGLLLTGLGLLGIRARRKLDG